MSGDFEVADCWRNIWGLHEDFGLVIAAFEINN